MNPLYACRQVLWFVIIATNQASSPSCTQLGVGVFIVIISLTKKLSYLIPEDGKLNETNAFQDHSICSCALPKGLCMYVKYGVMFILSLYPF